MERLQMRKIVARWVPHMLSESEKHRVNIARKLQRYGEDGDGESLQSMRHGFGLLNPNQSTKAVNGIQETPQDP